MNRTACLVQVLVSSWHPLTVYQYCDGLARFATEKYTLDDIDGRCAHLTNYSLNKHSASFVNDDSEESGSKWSLAAFKRRLVLEIGERGGTPRPRHMATLRSRPALPSGAHMVPLAGSNPPSAPHRGMH